MTIWETQTNTATYDCSGNPNQHLVQQLCNCISLVQQKPNYPARDPTPHARRMGFRRNLILGKSAQPSWSSSCTLPNISEIALCVKCRPMFTSTRAAKQRVTPDLGRVVIRPNGIPDHGHSINESSRMFRTMRDLTRYEVSRNKYRSWSA
jgi:hypothetical protein